MVKKIWDPLFAAEFYLKTKEELYVDYKFIFQPRKKEVKASFPSFLFQFPNPGWDF